MVNIKFIDHSSYEDPSDEDDQEFEKLKLSDWFVRLPCKYLCPLAKSETTSNSIQWRMTVCVCV